MKKEAAFLNIISKTLSNSEFLGDDCAYLPEYNIVISTDALVEDVHFSLKTISSYQLGKKALLVNISDILASGAVPKYLTITLSGNLDEEFVENFYKGANEICSSYGLKIIGGDLTGGDKIGISVTVFGDTKGRNISSRKNAKPGHTVLLAGYHGSSAAGFKILNNMQEQLPSKQLLQKKDTAECLLVREDIKKEFIQAHLEPVLYPKISKIVAENCKNPYAMMDTSDGLYDGLKKISEASNVGFKIEYDKILKKINDFNTVMFGGEDYGLLICLEKKDCEKILPYLADENITIIGEATEEKRILVDNKEIMEDLSYDHF